MERTTLSTHLGQYLSAVDKLVDSGLQFNGTRLERYAQLLNKCISNEENGDDSHHGKPEFLNALLESSEIVLAATLPSEALNTDAASLRIKVLPKGNDTVAAEGADPGRDALLELTIAATFHSAGYFGFFTEDAYDIATAEGTPVECKRVTSLKSLRNRIREARIQLRTATDSGLPAGVIALDFTRPIYTSAGPLIALNDEEFMTEADERLQSYLKNYVFNSRILQAAESESTLGILVRATFIGVSGEVTNARRFTSWQVLCTHEDNTEATGKLLNLAKKIAPISARKSAADLVRAARKYPS